MVVRSEGFTIAETSWFNHRYDKALEAITREDVSGEERAEFIATVSKESPTFALAMAQDICQKISTGGKQSGG